MKTSTFNYIKEILADYLKTDEYIRRREEELRHPYQEAEQNIGSGKSNIPSKPTERLAISISTDRRLTNLERNKAAIKRCLNESDSSTRKIVNECYIKKNPTLTIIGVAQQLYISKSEAYKLRNIFFQKLADELGL